MLWYCDFLTRQENFHHGNCFLNSNPTTQNCPNETLQPQAKYLRKTLVFM